MAGGDGHRCVRCQIPDTSARGWLPPGPPGRSWRRLRSPGQPTEGSQTIDWGARTRRDGRSKVAVVLVVWDGRRVTQRGYPRGADASMDWVGGQLSSSKWPPRGQLVSHARYHLWLLAWLATAGFQGTAAHRTEAAPSQQWNQRFAWLLTEGQQPLPTPTYTEAPHSATIEHRRLQSEFFTAPLIHCAHSVADNS